jgi:hypothetical protein
VSLRREGTGVVYPLLLRNKALKGAMLIKHWSQAMQAFSIIFEGRVPTLDGQSFTQFI